MPYTEHPIFVTPTDLNIPIWRYMDLPKFVSMLMSDALFFSSLKKLRDDFDPFEGSVSRQDIAIREIELAAIRHDLRQNVRDTMEKGNRDLMRFIFGNCWHMSAHESAAMWNIYAQRQAGIAIQSTFARLRESFTKAPMPIYLGIVKYVDYDISPVEYAQDAIPQLITYRRALHKRLSFAYEQELRAVVSTLDRLPDDPVGEGMSIVCDLRTLIERIVVSPTAPVWFFHVVESLVSRYGLNNLVDPSSLADTAIY